MNNNLYQATTGFKSGVAIDQKTIGGISKTERIINIGRQMESIEKVFMNISFKATRSENQKENRRQKR